MSGLDGGEGDHDRGLSPVTVVLGVVAVVAIAVLVGFVVTDVSPEERTGPGGSPTDGGPQTTSTTGTPEPLPASEPLDGTRSLANSDVVIRGEGDDELGYAVGVGDVNGDGTPDVVLGAPFSNVSGPRSGAVFVFFGAVDPGNLTVADADVRLHGESGGDWAGNSVDVGDVDGDGVADLVVGAPRNDAGEENAGAVYVVYGGADLNGTVSLESADETLTGTVPDGLAGYSVAAANVTGDAGADLVVGAPRGEESPGRAYILDGQRVATTDSLDEANATLVGEQPGDEAGWRVAVAGNLTGEGEPAVVVGAPRNGAAGENAGAVYAVTPPFDGQRSLGDALLILRGPDEGAFAGWSVAAPGDVDGDGRPAVLVGAPFAGSGGTAYVVDEGTGERSLGTATALRGTAAGDRAGWVVAGTDDVTCDGRPDVLVGAPRNDTGGEDAGAVYVVGGNESTDLANAAATLVGPAAGDKVGRADALGTLSGENATGLVVGAPFGEPPQTAHVVYATCPDG